MAAAKPRLAVHKLTSCDGCQLALLNLGEALLAIAGRVEIVHFPELGPNAPDAEADIALVEGSLSTPGEIARIQRIRAHSRLLVAIGACATTGGVQALRNFGAQGGAWRLALYPEPAHIETNDISQPISAAVSVDLELHGCPIDGHQLLAALIRLLAGGRYQPTGDTVCQECKRAGQVCVLAAKAEPCLGPVTRAGCGALCPHEGRACYACFGPAPLANLASLKHIFRSLGLDEAEIERRFHFITATGFAHHDTD